MEPRPLRFGEEATDQVEGVPIIEFVLRAFVGQCQECGCGAEDQDAGSVLIRPVVVEGTLYGDTFCVGCVDEDAVPGPVFVLPPLPGAADFLGEGGE